MTRSRCVKLFTLLGASVLLSGCISLLPEARQAPRIYKLTSQTEWVSANVGAPVLMINYPTAPKAISGNQIALAPEPGRIAYAARSSWVAPVPQLIQQAALDAMSADETVAGVLPASGARGDYLVQINVRSFEALFDNGEKAPPLASVQILVSLTDATTKRLLASTPISATVRARDVSVGSIVEAKRLATRDAMTELASWAHQSIVSSGS